MAQDKKLLILQPSCSQTSRRQKVLAMFVEGTEYMVAF